MGNPQLSMKVAAGQLIPAAIEEVTKDFPPNSLNGKIAPGWARTSDPLLRRQMLYPLSYGSIATYEARC